MCIEYNECHYGGMYDINVKIIFVITEIVHMNAGVRSEKGKVKESQSGSVTPSLDTPSGAGLGPSHIYEMIYMYCKERNMRIMI